MRVRALHQLRGLAALYVVAVHASTLLWTWSTDSAAGQILAGLFVFGHQAVLLFFVISGFCIHQRQAKNGLRRIDLAGFGVRRVIRLWPPLALALVVTAACDALGTWIDPGLYSPLGLSYSASTLLGNLLMQANLSVPFFGTNIPLWSLAVEGWLYALYPLLLVWFARLGTRRSMLVLATLSIGSDWLLRQSISWWPLSVFSVWSVWAAGAVLAEAHARGLCPKLLSRLGPASIALVLGAFAVTANNSALRERVPDAAWGLMLTLALAYLLLARPRTITIPHWIVACLDRLGDVSYSLYLIHFPWVVLIAAWWRSSRGAIPEGPLLMLGGIASSVTVAGIAWYCVERHCARPRQLGRPRQMRPTRQKNHSPLAA